MSKNAKLLNKAKGRKAAKGGPSFDFNKESKPGDPAKVAAYIASKKQHSKRTG